MADRPRPSLAITAPKFEPYALAIGQMALAWNELYEVFGTLFTWAIAEDPRRNWQCAQIWAAVTSDRQKRMILDAAINNIGKISTFGSLDWRQILSGYWREQTLLKISATT